DGWPAPTVTVSGLPSWLSFDSATATLSGTPSLIHAGTTGTITVRAANGISPDATETFTIDVAPTNTPSVVLADGSPVVQSFAAGLPAGWGATTGWEFGIPATGGASVGPPSVFDGPLAATGLSSNYSANALESMVTQVYDLTTVT